VDSDYISAETQYNFSLIR